MTDPCPAKERAAALHRSGPPASKTKGEIGFEFYSDRKNGLTFDGRKIPPFRETGPDVQDGWDMTAEMLYEWGRLDGYARGRTDGYADGVDDGKDECCPPESARMSDRTLG